ncbi:MAG: heparinase II/III family protein [candidate division KSB1 bacterium]|nr:heparinase II/III family protein [candidate division KSB1 bacterium]MDZ7304562.1 heparinase II/III family protein [candidate division KSB1 bacterium]MDZ7313643.1 heparinase II/III family protein [candidate division KSB1 bacterium]
MTKKYFHASLFALLFFFNMNPSSAASDHPRLMADATDIANAKRWLKDHPWYREIFDEHQAEIDRFIRRRPLFVSPIKQIYQYKMYTCPKHDVELLYEEFRPYEHRCPKDTNEVYSGGKFDSAWSGWYNRLLASHLVWMGIFYQVYDDEKYAEAAREILLKFADLYLQYPTTNTILGPAHVFFGTLSESFWGVDMAYGYDLVYNYKGFTTADHQKLKKKLFYPLAEITQKFPELASNRQLWYNNVSAAVGFLYNDQKLIDFALKGEYGFEWQLGSALPESGFWAEWSGYHYVALRGMIHLAEMARHNGLDLYHKEIAGRSMKKMFDVPFALILPNYQFPRLKDSGGGNILEYAAFYEIGYAIYRDPKYLTLLNLTNVQRGTQVVGEESGLGRKRAPITVFNLAPDLPTDTTTNIYSDESFQLDGNGFAILRNGKEHERRYLYLDYGIMGGEHGHPDRLQMGYFALGENWIVDPLNESYFNPNLQLWYRQTIAHNTVVIDQTSQTWTNGYGNFFGALPNLQVASGSSETAYPGAKLTRTLLQVGDYFIDLFDLDCSEKRMIDWPLHSFGRLTINGIKLEKQPRDLFGHPPGIPGYDQLTEIYAGRTDGAWSGNFALENGRHLLVKAIAEPNTEVFQAITPPIGGFYKQMVKDPKPVPMLMSRRVTNSTRFAHLIHAYAPTPIIVDFEKGKEPNTYRVRRLHDEDVLFADVANSRYWVLHKEKNMPVRFSGFGVREITSAETTLLSTALPLAKIECVWQGDKIAVELPEYFGQVKIWAPNVNIVELNGKPAAFQRDGEFVLLRQPSGVVIAAEDSTLFLGMKNNLTVRVWNPTDRPVTGRVHLSLPRNWKERVHSQLTWWGGIVNLKATNKGPIQRKIFPAHYRQEARWIDGVVSESKQIAAGEIETFVLPVVVPNEAPPVNFEVSIGFDNQAVAKSLRVTAPVEADLMLPNAEKEMLWVKLKNQTGNALKVAAKLTPHSAWQISGETALTVTLTPHETRRLTIPIRLVGYNPDSQLYPIRLRIESENFQTEIVRDFYIGVAHFADKAPALDGSWDGWEKQNPITIDKVNQVCKLLMGNQPWRGPEDLSAKIYAMYDKEYLYVGAEVTDDVVVAHWNFPVMSYPWDTDCMEVVLDTRTGSDQGADPPTPGLFRHLSMAEYRTTDFGPTMWQGGGAGGPLLPKPNLVPGTETYFHRTEKGYNIVCRCPLTSLKNVIAEPGYKIGFDVAINDNDGTSYRKNQHIWAGFNQNQSWWDMGTIGAMIFK